MLRDYLSQFNIADTVVTHLGLVELRSLREPGRFVHLHLIRWINLGIILDALFIYLHILLHQSQ